MLEEGLRGVVVPYGPGSPAWGDGESCPGGGRCSRRTCGGSQFPTAQAHQPGGRGSPAQVVVGAPRGPVGDSCSQRPGLTSLGGQGVLPRLMSVLKEGLRGVSVPYGPGSPTWGDGESCPGGGHCSRRACGGD